VPQTRSVRITTIQYSHPACASAIPALFLLRPHETHAAMVAKKARPPFMVAFYPSLVAVASLPKTRR